MTETILLDVQIDQSDAQKQLVQTEKNLLSLKKQQADLTKEYKAGKISQDDYVEANLRLQKAITKENDQKRTLNKLIDTESNSRNALKNKVSVLTKEYDNLNTKTAEGAQREKELAAELAHLNAEITKTSKNAGLFKDQIGNYPDQFSKIGSGVAKATDEIQPFGVSVSGATSSMSKFINPAGAVLGLLAGLGTMYAKSAQGAQDLEFAQNQLSSAFSIASNTLGELLSTGNATEGKGLFSTLVSQALGVIAPVIAAQSALQAKAEANIKNLEVSRAFAQASAKDDERRAENARRIRDDESRSLDERLAKTEEINQVLSQSAQRSVIVIKAQIQAIKNATTNYEKNREAQLQVAQLEAEIADKQEEINGKLTENVTARRAILKLIEEENALTNADNRAQRRSLDTAPEFKQVAETGAKLQEQVQADIDARLLQRQKETNEALLKEKKDFYDRDVAAAKTAAQLKEQVEFAQLQTTATIAGAAASLFDQQSDEYKALASAQVLISTYSAATKAYEAAFLPLPTVASPALGAAFAAAAIAQGLANLAAINGVQFADGGYTGPGSKYQPAGIVHAGEYVAPQSVVKSPAAQPHINALESMRTGKRTFADGGFVSEQMISPYQMAMITANAIRNMPAPVVGVREFNKVARGVEVREQISRR